MTIVKSFLRRTKTGKMIRVKSHHRKNPHGSINKLLNLEGKLKNVGFIPNYNTSISQRMKRASDANLLRGEFEHGII